MTVIKDKFSQHHLHHKPKAFSLSIFLYSQMFDKCFVDMQCQSFVAVAKLNYRVNNVHLTKKIVDSSCMTFSNTFFTKVAKFVLIQQILFEQFIVFNTHEAYNVYRVQRWAQLHTVKATHEKSQISKSRKIFKRKVGHKHMDGHKSFLLKHHRLWSSLGKRT